MTLGSDDSPPRRVVGGRGVPEHHHVSAAQTPRAEPHRVRYGPWLAAKSPNGTTIWRGRRWTSRHASSPTPQLQVPLVASPRNPFELAARGRLFRATSSHLWRHSASRPDSPSIRFSTRLGLVSGRWRRSPHGAPRWLPCGFLDAPRLEPASPPSGGTTRPSVVQRRERWLGQVQVNRSAPCSRR